ncbi:MAG: DUF1559 domain-containing protein [Pirellulaceae bacterium]|jgi:prepilin-type N-terminal cleavage/methylation domain-containing protein|nr:DUF1559 domain-containing protein [Pirellulaceae bacterium]
MPTISRVADSHSRAARAFSLIEFLAVMVIVGVLLIILLPAISGTRVSAHRMQCANQMRQLGIALHNYQTAHRVLPPGWVGAEGEQPWVDGSPGWAWGYFLLPYLEQTNVATSVTPGDGVMDRMNAGIRTLDLVTFRCPGDSRGKKVFRVARRGGTKTLTTMAVASYPGVFGPRATSECEGLPAGQPCDGGGVFFLNSRVTLSSIADGMSQTLFVGERSMRTAPAVWLGVPAGGQNAIALAVGSTRTPPNDPGKPPDGFSSVHPYGVNFVIGDGAVRFILDDVEPTVYKALSTRDGAEPISDSWKH